jgi:hypothetical protein
MLIRSALWKGDMLMSITSVYRPGSSVKPLDVTFMLANVVGIAIYLVLASRGWRIPREHGMVPVTGEPFVWVLALPVLGVFFVGDVVWGVMLLYRKERNGRLWWVLIAITWLVAIGVDFSHH